jgi:hypothetical protein
MKNRYLEAQDLWTKSVTACSALLLAYQPPCENHAASDVRPQRTPPTRSNVSTGVIIPALRS